MLVCYPRQRTACEMSWGDIMSLLAARPGPDAVAGCGDLAGAGPAAFLRSYPGYRATAVLDQLRASEYGYLDAGGHVYLDYTGAGLAAQSQLDAHADRLRGRCFGNPHSLSPASMASTELIERTRHAVLDHFRASHDEYSVIFTQNASAACRLVGEAYPFRPAGRLVLTADNHNSVNGIREFARAGGAVIEYIPFSSAELRVSADAVGAALGRTRPGRVTVRRPARRLLAFPAQSNFSGVQHDLGWIDIAHEHGYDVLLDAAAYAPASRLDLSAVHPDFVPVSWYKMFGYPTGVGCLIARRAALARLARPWFSGGTIAAVSVLGDWHVLAGEEARFEDGTPSFLHVPDVELGLSWVNGIGLDIIHERVRCLTGWMLNQLGALRHRNGEPMIRLHGPAGTSRRGGTVAFNLLDPDGQITNADEVARAAGAAGISIRTGCFCNPGAAERAFGLSKSDTLRALHSGARTENAYRAATGMPPGGAVRASLGLASNIDDVESFLAMLETTYRDRVASHS
jgi:selenocysteine lyase/cysteine desulfurase